MSIIGRAARAATPRSVKRFLRQWHRRHVFDRAMSGIARDPKAFMASGVLDYSQLTYGWGNEGWSAPSGFLTACLAAARLTRGPILECGTGLSTLLLGVLAKNAGTTVWSLEHHPGWAKVVSSYLTRYAIDSVRVCVNPLRDYGTFQWYEPPMHALPNDFSLVVCDGPPGSTPGGRSGMLPVMRSRLASGCLILLDDTTRPEEQAIAAAWGRELASAVDYAGDQRAYAELRVP